MNDSIQAAAARTDLIPPAVPGVVVFLLALAGVLLWGVARYLTTRHRERLPWYGVFGPRVLTAAAALWAVLQALARVCILSGPWPVWLAALGGAALIEGTAEFYRHERRVIPPRLGLALTLLRGFALFVAVVVLMQPVRVWNSVRNISRRVVVLLDDSQSMHFTDRQWTTTEMIEVAQQAGLLEGAERPLPALNALAQWPAALRPWPEKLAATNRTDGLEGLLAKTLAQARDVQAQTEAVLGRIQSEEDAGVKTALQRLRAHLADEMIPALEGAQKDTAAQPPNATELKRAAGAAERAAAMVATTHLAADSLFWRELGNDRREAIAAHCATTRVALARGILARAPKGSPALFDRLKERYDVDLLRMGAGLKPLPAGALQAPAEAPAAEDQAFRSLTDYATVLEKVLNDTPSEELAGVLIVSDGRNNGAAGLEPVGRRLGLQGVPVCGVVVGGSRLPRDVAIAEVQAPESIFLGDKVRMTATIRVTGARGSRLKLTLSGPPDGTATNAAATPGEVVLDDETIQVFTDDYTREVRLTHEPKEHGIRSYTLKTDVLDGELFATNNQWRVDVAVSDDRTNVLLVDRQPRWEFRYLRNLFFGRDKSVHLQYLLEEPDTTEGVTPPNLPPASASRKFGDAESGALPVSRDEWRMFDMIILGDVSPTLLTPEVLADIRHCVTERGALLVILAGVDYMPRTYDNEILREMLPIDYETQLGDPTALDRLSARLRLTPAGKTHPVMQQSESYSENEAIWQDMQEITWRYPVRQVKPGADVLAYAEPTEAGEGAAGAAVDLAAAAGQLDAETRERERNALITVQRYGRGKVMMLNFDQTWRLRYKIGDTYHHRLWGQIMRWGVGEKLRAGEDHLRLGTDQLTYTPGQVPRVLARVTATNFVGVADAQLEATLSRAGKEIARVTPAYREGSHGMYEAALPACEAPGRYDLALRRKDGGRDDRVSTAFVVVSAEHSVELADVTATRADLGVLAQLTGGRVVGPDQAAELWNVFGEGRTPVQERHERSLWDRPWVLLGLLGLLTTEWLLRKRGGLT